MLAHTPSAGTGCHRYTQVQTTTNHYRESRDSIKARSKASASVYRHCLTLDICLSIML